MSNEKLGLAQREKYWSERNTDEKVNALAALVQEPMACEPQLANDDGWCDWVCPKPIGYLMQCCDCGLIHEMELRVAKYQPRPSELFEVVSDPDLEVQFRMKRRDDISPNSDAVWKAMLEASK